MVIGQDQDSVGGTFMTYCFLAAGGLMVIGQAQDSVGGTFSAQESFIGSMTGLHVWDRNLTEQELTSLIHDCSVDVRGNVVAWPDFQTGLVGKVDKVSSKFCAGKRTVTTSFVQVASGTVTASVITCDDSVMIVMTS